MADPVVNVEAGKLKGKASKTDTGFPYFTFMGIPYAAPPVGELRFCETQPPKSWEGIRDATKTSNFCAQFSSDANTIVGSEDCLYLNVYTPKIPSTEQQLLPVMVYIHGGGFIFGSGTDNTGHGPDFLIDKDVVIVSINYRLGILGFLSLDMKEAPGNMGLKDQVLALKWIQKNITSFGGDPNNVTIFGSSAGGVSVCYLMLSSLAKGLFHKAIAQSGSPLLHWAHNTDIKRLASKIPSLQNKIISDDEELLKYLKAMPMSELVSASMVVLKTEEFRGGIHFGFVPTVEKPGDWDPFLSKSPYQVLAQGEFNRVPLIAGFCTREGLIMVSVLGVSILEKFLKNQSFVDNFPFHIVECEKSELENKLKTIYLEGPQVHEDADAYAIDFFTDVDIAGGVFVFAKLVAKYNVPVYFYEFSYDGNFNSVKKNYNIDRKGACHADEVGYILKNEKLTGPITDADAAVRATITNMWTDFAKHGNPTPQLSNLISTAWEPWLTGNKEDCLVIDKTIKTKQEVYSKRMRLYEEMYSNNYGTALGKTEFMI